MRNNISQRIYQAAFSLIEMMFVIIIIAAIALYAVNMVRSRASDAAVTTTADTMVQWLQASQNYYAQNTDKKWPQSWDDLYDPTNKVNYLPLSSGCSKIIQSQTYSCPSGTSASCGQYGPMCISFPQGFNNTTATYIIISTPVAETSLGQKVANLVPNGSYSDGWVSAASVLPGTAAAKEVFYSEVGCDSATAISGQVGSKFDDSQYGTRNNDISVSIKNADNTPNAAVSACECFSNYCSQGISSTVVAPSS